MRRGEREGEERERRKLTEREGGEDEEGERGRGGLRDHVYTARASGRKGDKIPTQKALFKSNTVCTYNQ